MSIVYSLTWLGKVGNSWYFTIRLHSWFMFANNHIGYDCFVGVAQSLSAELSKSYQLGIVEMFLITLHSIFYLSTL